MDKLNVLHKFLMIAVAALFIVNQTVLFRIEKDIHDALPELRIKHEVLKQGTGELARVVVTLSDERTIEGHIAAITDDGFTLVDDRGSKDVELAFRRVKDITKSDSDEGMIGRGLKTTARALESIARSVQ